MISIIVKVSAVLMVAAIVQAIIHRRASAAMRHFVWTLAVASVLLLPVLSLALPGWPLIASATSGEASHAIVQRSADASASARRASIPSVEVAHPTTPATAAIGDAVRARADRAPSTSWSAVVASIYAAGLVVVLVGLVMQHFAVRRLARQTTELRDGEWALLLNECVTSLGIRRPVRVLRSREHSMPMAVGTWRPAIVIPSTADTWPDDRRRAVILHELAHVARCDCLTQMLAFVACAVYWFHPAMWWVARRLRIERELACDDRVIEAGAGGRDYAGHLLEIAYSLGRHRAPVLAVSMARARQLEGRILAALDAGRNRTTPRFNVFVASIVATTCVVVPVAVATSRVVAAEAPPAAVSVATPPAAAPQEIGQSLKSWAALIREYQTRLSAAAAAIGVPQDRVPGTWEIRPTGNEGMVHLRLVELNSSSGTDVAIDQLQGLTGAQLKGTGGPVQFRLQRDAGTFAFEGIIRSGVGAGTFSFTANPNFPEAMAKRGFARPTSSEQYQMARNDVGFAFIDELNKHGYAKPETSELVRAGQHGVRADYVRDMAGLGYRLGSLAPLIELRDHGVGPTYVRELADQGYKGLPADELRRARDHGISPDYVRAMRENGYGSLKMDQLINARDHGVSAEYARDMRQLGYNVALDELISARDHGVSVEFVREMTSLGYDKLPLDTLIRARDHGVSPKYVQELKSLGYERLSIDDLVTLRDHGLSAERIRTANSRAGTRLPVDMLKSFAAGGMR